MMDFLLILQTCIYLLISMAGFTLTVPVAVLTGSFNDRCMFFGDFKWKNDTHFTMYSSNFTYCKFPIYSAVFTCIIYGGLMFGYYVYALHRSLRTPDIAKEMWVMPFILTNAAFSLTLVIVSAIVSGGSHSFCNGLTKGKTYKKCADGQNKKWIDIDTMKPFSVGPYYILMIIAVISSWLLSLFFVCQIGLGVIRWRLNSAQRAKFGNANVNNSDKVAIATVEPTA